MLFSKTYKNSEELFLDLGYPKKAKSCLDFIRKTLAKGEPYPAGFSQEKLLVYQILALVNIKNDASCALEYANEIKKVMPFVIQSLKKPNRKDSCLHNLPEASMEKIYQNLSAQSYAKDERALVAFVLAFQYISTHDLEVLYDLPEGKLVLECFEVAQTYSDKSAVELLVPQIQKELARCEIQIESDETERKEKERAIKQANAQTVKADKELFKRAKRRG